MYDISVLAGNEGKGFGKLEDEMEAMAAIAAGESFPGQDGLSNLAVAEV